jgi:hypothetical protein
VALVGRSGLVSHVVDDRVGPIAALFDVGHHTSREWRYVVGLVSHAEIGADEIDVEPHPLGSPDAGHDAETDGSLGDRLGRTHLKGHPVDVEHGGFAYGCLRDLRRRFPVEVDVETSPHADLPSKEGSRPLQDPPVVDEVEALEDSVVRELPLELLDGPSRRRGTFGNPGRQRGAEGPR